jgi:hypothetical protein
MTAMFCLAVAGAVVIGTHQFAEWWEARERKREAERAAVEGEEGA